MALGKEEYDSEYLKYQLNRGVFRKKIRNLYHRNIIKYIKSPIIDFGCGTGELLSFLSNKSIGLEINKKSIAFCKKKNLNVEYYDAILDDFNLSIIGKDRFRTLIVSHVLEHFTDPKNNIKKLFISSFRLGIKRIVFVLPGEKGFKYDKTHKTFINKNYLHKNDLLESDKYKVLAIRYFPFNNKYIGKIFTHNEMVVVYEKK